MAVPSGLAPKLTGPKPVVLLITPRDSMEPGAGVEPAMSFRYRITNPVPSTSRGIPAKISFSYLYYNTGNIKLNLLLSIDN